MNNIVKITSVTFISLFLFACDAGTTKSGGGGGGDAGTYSVKIDVSGLAATRSVTVNNKSDSKTVDINSTEPVTISTGLATGTSYAVTVATHPIAQVCTLGGASGTIGNADVTVSVNCDGTGLVGVYHAGKDYYNSECAVCHRSATDDASKAFGGQDLALKYQTQDTAGKYKYINTDMHADGPQTNLMGRFDNVKLQFIADLQVYLETAPVDPNATP